MNVVSSIDGNSEEFLHRGEDCMDVFVKKIIEAKDKIMNNMKENKKKHHDCQRLEGFQDCNPLLCLR